MQGMKVSDCLWNISRLNQMFNYPPFGTELRHDALQPGQCLFPVLDIREIVGGHSPIAVGRHRGDPTAAVVPSPRGVDDGLSTSYRYFAQRRVSQRESLWSYYRYSRVFDALLLGAASAIELGARFAQKPTRQTGKSNYTLNEYVKY